MEGSFDLETSADRALQFFTPEGERAWVKDWNPKPVYPPQAGVAFRRNAVFRVGQGEERSLWTILEADEQKHTAEYVYVVEGERLSRVRVEITPLDAQHCRVRVRYVHTATSEKGLQFVVSTGIKGSENHQRQGSQALRASAAKAAAIKLCSNGTAEAVP